MLRMSLRWRLIAAISSLVLAIVLTIVLGFGWSFIFWLVFVIFVIGYFLLGTISAASEKLNIGDMDGAERILGYTKFPNWLLKMNRAYYTLLKGMIAMQRSQSTNDKEEIKAYRTEAETLLQEAYDIGLPTENDKATVLIQLANLNMAKGTKHHIQQAKVQIRQIKEMNITEPTLLMRVKEMDDVLKRQPRGMGMQAMKYRGMGGKMMQQRMVQQGGEQGKKTNNRKSSSKRKKKKK